MTQEFDKPFSGKKVLSRTDLKNLGINRSNTTLLRWEDARQFPKRIYLGGTGVAWLAEEVDAWLINVAAKRVMHHHRPRR